MNHRTIVIGLSGLSSSGKTTLARALHQITGCITVRMDNYYRETTSRLEETNFDDPCMIDDDALADDLQSLKRGESILARQYDFNLCRVVSYTPLHSHQVVIVEGQYVGYFRSCQPLLDVSVFVSCPYEICLDRRIQRDHVYLSRPPLETEERFRTQVIPGFEKVRSAIEQSCDLVVPGDNVSKAASLVMERIYPLVSTLNRSDQLNLELFGHER